MFTEVSGSKNIPLSVVHVIAFISGCILYPTNGTNSSAIERKKGDWFDQAIRQIT